MVEETRCEPGGLRSPLGIDDEPDYRLIGDPVLTIGLSKKLNCSRVYFVADPAMLPSLRMGGYPGICQ